MSMSNFMAFALTRSEMKRVVGGQCHYYDNWHYRELQRRGRL